MDQILKKGKVSRGFIGILPEELTPDMAKAFGMPNVKGVAIASVEPDTPALRAGLKVGDVITAINGTPVDDVNAFRFQIAGFEAGTTGHLKIARGGQTPDVPVQLAGLGAKAEGPRGRGAVPGPRAKGALHGVSVEAPYSTMRANIQPHEGPPR